MIKALNNFRARKALAIVALCMVALSISSCRNFITEPKPPAMQTELTNGPEEYRLGYKHGCESALAAYGNSMQKTFYHLQKDPRFQNSRMYNQIWKDGWNYCYMWLFVWHMQGF